MATHRATAGLALVITGCVFFALSARTWADVVPESYADSRQNTDHAILKSGTLGIGFEYRLPLDESISLRMEQFARTERQYTNKTFYKYNLYAHMQSRSLALDWRPLNGAFHTSIGVFINQFDAGGNGATDGTFEISGQVSQAQLTNFLAKPDIQQFLNDHGIDASAYVAGFSGASGSATIELSSVMALNAKVEWNRIAPYLGFGWSNTVTRQRGLLYSFDVGAMYIGRPKVSVSVSGPLADEINRQYSAEWQSYIDNERSQLEDSLARYRVLPVASFGLAYRF